MKTTWTSFAGRTPRPRENSGCGGCSRRKRKFALGPADVREIELISMPELQEIRNLWLYEKHEFDDSLPAIFQAATGKPFPKPTLDDNPLGAEDWNLLQQVCGDDEEFFGLQASLLDIEREFCGMSRRAGIYDRLEDRLKAGQFGNEQEALRIRRDEERRRREADAVGGEPALVQLAPLSPEIVQRGLFADDMETETAE